jgi:hypothetical protein
VTQTNENVTFVEAVTGNTFALPRPYPLSWSPDEQYMYMIHRVSTDGCFPGENMGDIHRVDLATSVSEEIATEGYGYEVSPDGTKLAYLSRERGLVILDLESSEESETSFDIEATYPNLFLSQLAWSPNYDALLAIAIYGVCVSPDPIYFLIHIDLETLKQAVLINENPRINHVIEWTVPEKVLLRLFHGELIWMNTSTGEFTSADE